jgi:hypothetical protein
VYTADSLLAEFKERSTAVDFKDKTWPSLRGFHTCLGWREHSAVQRRLCTCLRALRPALLHLPVLQLGYANLPHIGGLTFLLREKHSHKHDKPSAGTCPQTDFSPESLCCIPIVVTSPLEHLTSASHRFETQLLIFISSSLSSQSFRSQLMPVICIPLCGAQGWDGL